MQFAPLMFAARHHTIACVHCLDAAMFSSSYTCLSHPHDIETSRKSEESASSPKKCQIRWQQHNGTTHPHLMLFFLWARQRKVGQCLRWVHADQGCAPSPHRGAGGAGSSSASLSAQAQAPPCDLLRSASKDRPQPRYVGKRTSMTGGG